MAGAQIDSATNAPISEQLNTTSLPGVFACGNCYRVYDIVDSVSRDAQLCGRMAAEFLAQKR